MEKNLGFEHVTLRNTDRHKERIIELTMFITSFDFELASQLY